MADIHNLPDDPTDLWHLVKNGLPRESLRAHAAVDKLVTLAIVKAECDHIWSFQVDWAEDRVIWGCTRCRQTKVGVI